MKSNKHKLVVPAKSRYNTQDEVQLKQNFVRQVAVTQDRLHFQNQVNQNSVNNVEL